jgi:hypothetical protein
MEKHCTANELSLHAAVFFRLQMSIRRKALEGGKIEG